VTGLLVRASQGEWRKGSVIAVDAGSHLASIIRILQKEMPRSSDTIPEKGYRQVIENGPFAGIKFPHISAKANALYIFRELLHSILITHPHLDHISGIAINTPALEYGREAKHIYGLPATIDAIKNHIFNDSIWPNLSDEGHGVGFVTFRRLIEGGNPRLGSGEARGYINVCDGLATKCWGVSHGKCHRRAHSVSHTRGESFGFGGNDYNMSRRLSRMSDDYFAVMEHHRPVSGAYTPGPGHALPSTPGVHGSQPQSAVEAAHMFEPVHSSAFFIRNDEDGKELLIFGDVEPDSVSISPRNHIVWADAAMKFVHGSLKAVFIECSYDDSVRDADLYGHLCPRHLVEELTFLAHQVMAVRNQVANSTLKDIPVGAPVIMPETPSHAPPLEIKRKRKRVNGTSLSDLTATMEAEDAEVQSGYVGTRSSSGTRRKTSHPNTVPLPATGIDTNTNRPGTPKSNRKVEFQAPGNPSVNIPSGGLAGPGTATGTNGVGVSGSGAAKLPDPLKGLSVHIIHVKDTLMDGPAPGTVILGQLREHGEGVGLGCIFDVCSWGESIWV
jgi:cAMP phosphodiesterase